MKEINKRIKNLVSAAPAEEFGKLINFIDAAIVQSTVVDKEEVSQFFIKNLLNMRDYLSSEMIKHSAETSFCAEVTSIISEESNNYEWTKKKEELEEELLRPEASLEIDPEMF